MTLGFFAGLAGIIVFLACLWGLGIIAKVHNGDIEL